ncbi:hypothetical protein AGMMS49975_12890 [Clostridia bacterium]|nr:hypothetical protein AGMMS49975_12890 [Clostridia bacterium]
MDNHIEIAKESIKKSEYKFKRNTHPPKPPKRDRLDHGNILTKNIDDSISEIEQNREIIGIEPNNFLVLELSANAISPKNIDDSSSKLNFFVVSEIKLTDNKSKLIVQFESKADINQFRAECEKYKNETASKSLLTSTQRESFFDCIDDIHIVSKGDRVGPRLKIALNKKELPNVFKVDIDVWNTECSSMI